MGDEAALAFGLVVVSLAICSIAEMAVAWHRWASLAARERQLAPSRGPAPVRPGLPARGRPSAARLLEILDRAWRASSSDGEGAARRRDDAIVYVELERALGRCERLQSAVGAQGDAIALADVRRALGRAAFIASGRLEAGERQALRTEARHRHARDAGTAADILLDDLSLLVDTAGVVTRQTRDPAVCEELHLAAGQIGHARQALCGLCARRRHDMGTSPASSASACASSASRSVSR